MFIDSNNFEEWMKRIMERFDKLEKRMDKPEEYPVPTINGERMFDNQDMCLLLNICKADAATLPHAGLATLYTDRPENLLCRIGCEKVY